MLAGRGFGKTRAGAEFINAEAEAGRARRIALVAATEDDGVKVMIQGPSGFLSIGLPEKRPTWAKGQLTWPNGAVATLYSASAPGALRGPESDLAWCFIAGTMISTPSGERPIETIAVGDVVLTRRGRRIVSANSSRCHFVGRVSFDIGRDLIGTADHPVLSSHGWTKLSDLAKGESVCAMHASTGVASDGTVTATGDTTNSGAQNRWPIRTATRCIELYIGRSLAQFRKASTFITRMMTEATTNWTTFSFFPTALIAPCMSRASLSQRPIGPVSQSQRSDADNLPLAHFSDQVRTAILAAQRSRASPATFVASVASTWEPAGEATVFNLQVDGTPEYFANGICVHNCDELAKWSFTRTADGQAKRATGQEAWDNLLFGLRIGPAPRIVVTTTPRPLKIIRELVASPRTHVTRGSTFDNAANLAPDFLALMREKYQGTRLGRQELNAEVLEDVPGALWWLAMFDQEGFRRPAPDLVRIVVSVDPSGARGADDSGADSIGIVVVGKGVDGRAYVLADRTCRLSPVGWGRRVVEAYREFRADRVIGERNFGGAMVESTIRNIEPNVSFKEVTASAGRGKVVRAEPAAALYEQNKVSHAGRPDEFEQLEAQMCAMTSSGFVGEGSPDRVDALVWGLDELMGTPGPADYIEYLKGQATEAAGPAPVLPWKDQETTPAEDGGLMDVYLQTFGGLTKPVPKCKRCGKEINGNRISDGVSYWCQGCK
jgi:phage terminase large subunit-like protein